MTDELQAICLLLYINLVINVALMNNYLNKLHMKRLRLVSAGKVDQAKEVHKGAFKECIYIFFIGWIMAVYEEFSE